MTHTAKHTTHWITRQGFRCTDIVDSVTKEDIGYFKDHSQALKAAAAPAMYEALQDIVEGLTDEITRMVEGSKPDIARLDYLANKAGLTIAQAEGRQP